CADADRGAVSEFTISLPTRRAVRALRDLLADRVGSEAAILPTIRPIGDASEEDALLAPGTETGAHRLVLPAAASPLARQLILTELTLAWGRQARRAASERGPGEPVVVPASPADATALAGDIAHLLDDMTIAGVGFDRIEKLAPDDQTGYFALTLDFLKIVAEFWPNRLEELGRADPKVRRERLIPEEAGGGA